MARPVQLFKKIILTNEMFFIVFINSSCIFRQTISTVINKSSELEVERYIDYFYKLKANASCDIGLKKTVISLFIITNYAQCNSGTFSSK
jgi:hypothetical protein